MDIRCQVASVFVIDRCLGCQACSVACKEMWTAEPGSEHAWWNNVECRPGAGYPKRWEDQEQFKGGWSLEKGNLRLKAGSRLGSFLELFHPRHLPTIHDYYEPFTSLPPDDSKKPPTSISGRKDAATFSVLTDEPGTPSSGFNWDDLHAGEKSARQDPNLDGASDDALPELERLLFYLPRICNHCLNPSCVAACPSASAYKREEDGIVLIDQEKCRSWQHCTRACPYKMVYTQFREGKASKCHLCYPQIEKGEGPFCFEACVGRARHQGYLLYDADRVPEVAAAPDNNIIEAMRSLILDPSNPLVISEALRAGIPSSTLAAARQSPVFRFFLQWKIALPLHPEWRTLPMTFYVPPLLDFVRDNNWSTAPEHHRQARYLADLFTGGQLGPLLHAIRKLVAVVGYRRALRKQHLRSDQGQSLLARERAALSEADSSVDEAAEILARISQATLAERVVLRSEEAAEEV